MHEIKPHPFGAYEVKSASPTQKVARFAQQMARDGKLDQLTSEGLEKFAVVIYRIENIRSDFRGTTLSERKYYISPDGRKREKGLRLTRENYSHFLQLFSTVAFGLHNTYLNKTEAARLAAKEVQNFINDMFPQIP